MTVPGLPRDESVEVEFIGGPFDGTKRLVLLPLSSVWIVAAVGYGHDRHYNHVYKLGEGNRYQNAGMEEC